MSQILTPVGSHPCAEYSDFILAIEGLTKIKYDQVFEWPNDESQQGYRGGIHEVQYCNSRVDNVSGVS